MAEGTSHPALFLAVSSGLGFACQWDSCTESSSFPRGDDWHH